MTTYGLVGVGRMGGAMARAVVAAGHDLMVHDTSAEAMASVPGASPARSPREVAEAASVIGIVVMDERQTVEVCQGADGLFAGATDGTVVLVHSTIAHAPLRALAAEARMHGVELLDAPVSGQQGHLSVPELCVMVGGDAEAFERARPFLESFGSLVIDLGPLGAGLDAKLALNHLRYLGFLVMQESTRLAEGTGIDEESMHRLVEHTGAFRYLGDFSKGRQPEDLPRRRLNVDTARKDLRAAVARAGEVGVEVPVAERTFDLLHTIWAVPPDEG